jgi:peptide/nickel transport system substrate-binding protein
MGSWGSYSINDVSAIFPVMYGGGALDDYAKRSRAARSWWPMVASTADSAVRKKNYSAAVKLDDRQGLLAAAVHLREHLRLLQAASR